MFASYMPRGLPADAVQKMSGTHNQQLVLPATQEHVSRKVARDIVASWAGVTDLSNDYVILESYLEKIRTLLPGSIAEVT